MAKKNKKRQRKNINSLIPMETPDGGRVFVNTWDVPERKLDGWKIIGDMRQHTSTTVAPTDALDPKKDPKKPGKKAAKKSGPPSGPAGDDDGQQDPKEPATAGA